MEAFRRLITGRTRKPTAALELSGAFKRNLQRRRGRAGEPVADGPVRPAPKHINDQARRIWNRIARSEAGTWLRVDALEVYCGLKGRSEMNPADMQSSRIALLNSEQTNLGLTATARSRALGAEEPEPNLAATFKGERRGALRQGRARMYGRPPFQLRPPV